MKLNLKKWRERELYWPLQTQPKFSNQTSIMFFKKAGLFSILFVSLFFISSCDKNQSSRLSSSSAKDRCIEDVFAQGQDENLYGVQCLKGKSLLVTTGDKGDKATTSKATNSLRIKEDDKGFFFNIYYSNLEYSIKKGTGADIPEVLKPDSKKHKINGSKNTDYHILFEFVGNYLVLFKAVKDLKHIPYKQKTSLSKNQDGTYKQDEKGFYKVPFLGYRIEYCNAELITNDQGEETYQSRLTCDDSISAETAKYVKLVNNEPELYNYGFDKKQDMFPANYFEGEWFFSKVKIEAPSSVFGLSADTVGLNFAHRVTVEKQSEGLDLIKLDVRGEDKESAFFIPVEWQEYEMDKDGVTFNNFGEREISSGSRVKDNDKKDYLNILFNDVETPDETYKQKTITDILIEKGYFSFVEELTTSDGLKFKVKISMLKRSFVDETGFTPKRVFKDDLDTYFNIFITGVPNEEQGVRHQEDVYEDLKMVRFNTNNPDPNTGTTVIKWYFSDQSVGGSLEGDKAYRCYLKEDKKYKYCENYRDIAKQAVDIWSRAFQIISDGKIKMELVTDSEGNYKEKELGDMRYNIIHLIMDRSPDEDGFIGVAGPTVNANTGQIIGGANNNIIHRVEDGFIDSVSEYIRFEAFLKDKKTKERQDIHVISTNLQKRIQEECLEVADYIQLIREEMKIVDSPKINRLLGISQFQRRSYFYDREVALVCGKKLAEPVIKDLILHEMGHSLGIRHNFKASVDKDNFYKSLDEIKTLFPEILNHQEDLKRLESGEYEIPKLSSVMDYSPLSQPTMSVVGKYDLAVLRYLYRGELERHEGEPIALDHTKSIENQEPLEEGLKVTEAMKKYKHCSDEVFYLSKDFLCRRHDYGSDPKEIVSYYIEEDKRLENRKYIYDNEIKGFIYGPRGNKGIKATKTSKPIANNDIRPYTRSLEPFSRTCSLYSSKKRANNNYRDSYRQKARESLNKAVDLFGRSVLDNREGDNANDLYNNLLKDTLNSFEQTNYYYPYFLGAPFDFYVELLKKRDINIGLQNLEILYNLNSCSKDIACKDYYQYLLNNFNNDEYPLYHPVKELFQNFLQDRLFTYTMKCKVQYNDNDPISIDLEDIKAELGTKEYYIEDCYSQWIVKFLAVRGFEIKEQYGVEAFVRYVPDEIDRVDVRPSLFHPHTYMLDLESLWWALKEPDFFHTFWNKLSTRLLDQSSSYSDLDNARAFNFYNIFLTFQFRKLRETKTWEDNKDNYFKVVHFPLNGVNNLVDTIYNRGGLSQAITNWEIPFLTSLFSQSVEDYKNSAVLKTRNFDLDYFKNYLLNNNNVVKEIDSGYMFPFKGDSFVQKAIVVYNSNLKSIAELENLEKQKGLSFLEAVQLKSKRRHNNLLKAVIQLIVMWQPY